MTTLTYDASDWLQSYPNGHATALFTRPDGVVTTPAAEMRGGECMVILSLDETATPGVANVEMYWASPTSEYLAKSPTFRGRIEKSQSVPEGVPPEASQSLLDQVMRYAAQAKAAADKVADASEDFFLRDEDGNIVYNSYGEPINMLDLLNGEVIVAESIVDVFNGEQI